MQASETKQLSLEYWKATSGDTVVIETTAGELTGHHTRDVVLSIDNRYLKTINGNQFRLVDGANINPNQNNKIVGYIPAHQK